MIHLEGTGNEEGKLDICRKLSGGCNGCHYKCCNQTESGQSDIFLYPGELEKAEKPKQHITILREFGGGNLGRCNKDTFDQSKCTDKSNFKPLECKSYPFFPFISGNKMVLRVDPNCPIPHGMLKDHHKRVLALWEVIVKTDPAVKDWISSINLDGYSYEEFTPDTHD